MSSGRRTVAGARRAALAASCAGGLLLLASGCANDATAPRAQRVAAAHADAIDATTRLDLADARLEQVGDREVQLQISAHAAWSATDVAPAATRELCVWLRNELARAPGGRLCVLPDAGAASKVRLRYTRLDHRGRKLGFRELPTRVERPDPQTISARIEPGGASLVPGTYRWYVRSRSRLIEDRLPDHGELTLTVAPSAAPATRERCFGAASRDPRRPCHNPKLRLAVVPKPDEAFLSTNSLCSPGKVSGELHPCRFGVAKPDAQATIALLGDSHAAHWRAPLEQVAQRKRWSGVSLTTSGCPLTRAKPALTPASRRAACERFNRQVPAWLARHREVRTVFVVGHAAAQVVVPAGSTKSEALADGYAAAWRALPKSVKRIVVIRDTPLLGFQNACVRRELERGHEPGPACALPRADNRVLIPDGALLAARRLGSRRVRVIDMTRYFCTATRCPPVIGGALLYKDREHITEVYGTTLAPYLRRAIDAL